jgi:hypothetical protein
MSQGRCRALLCLVGVAVADEDEVQRVNRSV